MEKGAVRFLFIFCVWIAYHAIVINVMNLGFRCGPHNAALARLQEMGKALPLDGHIHQSLASFNL